MTQQYSNPKRQHDPHALPDLEVFYLTNKDVASWRDEGHDIEGKGWYYWYCFPGCLPDSDIIGPFSSEDEALEDARGDN